MLRPDRYTRQILWQRESLWPRIEIVIITFQNKKGTNFQQKRDTDDNLWLLNDCCSNLSLAPIWIWRWRCSGFLPNNIGNWTVMMIGLWNAWLAYGYRCLRCSPASSLKACTSYGSLCQCGRIHIFILSVDWSSENFNKPHSNPADVVFSWSRWCFLHVRLAIWWTGEWPGSDLTRLSDFDSDPVDESDSRALLHRIAKCI